MASERRLEKLNNLIKEELGKILDREVDFPPKTIVTITRVHISPDVHYADIFISILGSEPQEALEFLIKKIYDMQQTLNRKLNMRPVPRIKFILDKEEFKREMVEKTLAKIKKAA